MIKKRFPHAPEPEKRRTVRETFAFSHGRGYDESYFRPRLRIGEERNNLPFPTER